MDGQATRHHVKTGFEARRTSYLRAIRGLAQMLGILAVAALPPFAPAHAEDRLPIFDCHLHYSEDAWASFPAEDAISTIRAAGVIGILVLQLRLWI